jgi:seryl-tRNA synthetase
LDIVIDIEIVYLCFLKIRIMLQIAFVRENQEKVIKALAKRNMDATTLVAEVVQLDEDRRSG